MSTRGKITVSVVLSSIAITAWWWIRDIRMLQYSELQLYSLAGAVANYMAVTKGDYPAGLESLRALRLVEDLGEGAIVALPSEACADSVRQFPGITIIARDYDVAWNGDRRGTDGVIIR